MHVNPGQILMENENELSERFFSTKGAPAYQTRATRGVRVPYSGCGLKDRRIPVDTWRLQGHRHATVLQTASVPLPYRPGRCAGMRRSLGAGIQLRNPDKQLYFGVSGVRCIRS
jgi:hypothetical protein